MFVISTNIRRSPHETQFRFSQHTSPLQSIHKTDQETQSPVLKIFTDMLAREKNFQGYRDPEKAALLRAEHKRDRDSKRDDRRGDDRKDDGKTATREDSDERRPRTSKKNKKPRTAKNRSNSNPKSKEKKKLKAKHSCHCPKTPTPPPLCDDACCQFDQECQQSSSKEDVELEENMEARVATTAREHETSEHGERIYEQRERVRERNFKKKMDDTCSCASCVSLKKMCRNDCICCCCVAFVFILCLFLAFMLVCKSIPYLRTKFSVFGPIDDLDSDRLKRKIDAPADMQWDAQDKKHEPISNKWEYDRLPGYAVPQSMDSKGYGDINLPHDSDLTKVINSDKLSEIQGNHQLREFYKKLLTTDAEIRKLKKDYLFNVETSNSIPYPDRAKRSLDILKSPFRMFRAKKKKINESKIDGKATEKAEIKKPNTGQEDKVKMKETKDMRVKRFDTNEDGLVLEKKKVSIHFVPSGRRSFKCSHAPKPSYQSPQRLDELLEKFLDKNDIDTLGEPYSRSMMTLRKYKLKNKNNPEKIGKPTKKVIAENDEKGEFHVNFNDAKNKMLKNSFRNNKNNNNKKIHHLSVDENLKLLDDQIEKRKLLAEHYNKNNQQTDAEALKEFLNSHGGAAKVKAKAKITTGDTKKGKASIKGNTETTTVKYNLLMSISTMFYKDIASPLPTQKPVDSHKVKDRALVGRRLMQTEMDDDEEAFEMPESEQDGEMRKRREYGLNPNNVINPNWKGPMPLYPDELNAVNKPSPVVVTTNKNLEGQSILLSAPKNGKLYVFKPRGTARSGDPKYLTDTEYVEDYFQNKYDKVADVAEAYSDYGALNDKNIMNQRREQRYREYVNVDGGRTTDIVQPMGKPYRENTLSWNSPEEGFKLQLSGPPSSRFHGMMETLQGHIKFTPDAETTTDSDATLEAFFAGHTFESTKGSKDVLDVKDILKVEKPTEFEFRNIKKRSLKSVDYYQNDDPSDAIESLMNFRGIFNGLQKKFSTKLGSAQDYAIRVASDYIHDGIYKRDVDSVDVDVVSDSIADDNITVTDNIQENYNITDVFNRTGAVMLVANGTDNSTAQTIETGVEIATGDVHNDTGATLSDFFMKLAHWFSLLDTLDLSANKSQQANFSVTDNATEEANDQPKFELNFPLYDADMIENIGHRSRVLLAVNESEPVDDRTPEGEGKGVADTKGVGVVGTGLTKNYTGQAKEVTVKSQITSHLTKVLENFDEPTTAGVNVLLSGDRDSENLVLDALQPGGMTTCERLHADAGGKLMKTSHWGRPSSEIDNTTTTNLETVIAKDNETKTIVKRNADLFWDDIYNDEDGTDAVNIDESDASKNVLSYSSKPAVKRNPKDWFKKMIDRLKEGSTCGHQHDRVDQEGHRKCGGKGKPKPKPKKPKPKQDLEVTASRRFYRKADDPLEEKKTDFAALTAKMKKICQKAAKDISLSKKLAVHEESKEGQVASKLMQQLIGLMSDLVDYQVHEKTCRKLPMDLQNFLEWLTNPESTVMTYHGKDYILAHSNKGSPHEEQFYHRIAVPTRMPSVGIMDITPHEIKANKTLIKGALRPAVDQYMMLRQEPIEEIHTLEAIPSEEEEPKADYMSVMSAVRDLLNRYDNMPDEDKSKMSGVKEYLEAQMEYLQKYMANDFNMLHTDISRYKRDAKVPDPHYHVGKVKSVYVTFRKYMRKQNEHGGHLTKNLHASNNQSTTSKVMTIAVAIEKVPGVVKSEKKIKKLPKRNLKDVYYRALEEAKLMTAATVEAKSTTALSSKTTDY